MFKKLNQMRLIIYSLLIIVFSCTGNSQNEKPPKLAIELSKDKSITIKNEVHKNEIIFWQVIDGYLDTEPPIEYSDKSSNRLLKVESPYPIKIITTDIDTTKPIFERESWTGFLVYPGDSLIAYKDKNGYTRLKSIKDSIRTNELDFFVNLKQNIAEIDGFRGSFPIKLPIDSQIKLSKERSVKIINYLNDFEQKKKINLYFKKYITVLCKYDTIYYMLRDYFSPFVLEKYKKKFNPNSIKPYNTLLQEFNCDECIDVDSYKISALLYTYFLCNKKGIKSNISNLYSVATENFKSKTKDYLLFRIVKMQMEKNMQEAGFQSILNRFYIDCKDENYITYIKNNILIMKDGQPSQNDFMSSALFGTKSKEILIKDLIESSKGKVIYIDLWASWCSPCIAEMPASHQLQQLYMGKEINFAFISLDKNRMAWEKSMTRVGINPENDSYILANNFESAFAKHFKISSIPRYILIGKDGKVISADAPRPSDPKLRKLFDELLTK